VWHVAQKYFEILRATVAYAGARNLKKDIQNVHSKICLAVLFSEICKRGRVYMNSVAHTQNTHLR